MNQQDKPTPEQALRSFQNGAAQAQQSEPSVEVWNLRDRLHRTEEACSKLREALNRANTRNGLTRGILLCRMSELEGQAAQSTPTPEDYKAYFEGAAQGVQQDPAATLHRAEITLRNYPEWSGLADECKRAGDALKAQATQGAGEVVYQVKGEAFCCPHAWRDATEEAFNVTHEQDRRVLHTHPTPAQPAPVVPEGWKLVPVDATQVMRDAGNKTLRTLATEPGMGIADRAFYVWCAMLTTTPTPPAQAAADAQDALLDRVHSALIEFDKGAERHGMTWQKPLIAALATHQQGGK
ncbi:MAG TPA: hypothetical protein VFM33_13940 [Aquabacterium sp.]|nr:hypothetical protein [Aquabacterium sp.]